MRKRYYPKHKWRCKSGGECKFCNIPDHLNDEGACRDCYTRAVERDLRTLRLWRLLDLIRKLDMETTIRLSKCYQSEGYAKQFLSLPKENRGVVTKELVAPPGALMIKEAIQMDEELGLE